MRTEDSCESRAEGAVKANEIKYSEINIPSLF